MEMTLEEETSELTKLSLETKTLLSKKPFKLHTDTGCDFEG